MKYLESANASSFDNFNIDNLYIAFEELEKPDSADLQSVPNHIKPTPILP